MNSDRPQSPFEHYTWFRYVDTDDQPCFGDYVRRTHDSLPGVVLRADESRSDHVLVVFDGGDESVIDSSVPIADLFLLVPDSVEDAAEDAAHETRHQIIGILEQEAAGCEVVAQTRSNAGKQAEADNERATARKLRDIALRVEKEVGWDTGVD